MGVNFVQSVALRQKSSEKWCQFMYNVTWLWGCREPLSTVIQCLLVWQDVAAGWSTSSLCLWTELSSYLQQAHKTNCQILKPWLQFLLLVKVLNWVEWPEQLFEFSIPCNRSVNAVELSECCRCFYYIFHIIPRLYDLHRVGRGKEFHLLTVWLVWSNSALCCFVLLRLWKYPS